MKNMRLARIHPAKEIALARPHITVVNFYPIFPFNHGGKLAIRDFYKALSEWFDITVVCLCGYHDIFVKDIRLTPHLNIVSLPLPKELEGIDQQIQIEYQTGKRCEPTVLMSIIRSGHYCTALIDPLREIIQKSAIVITEHIYAYRLVQAVASIKPIWYRAQNVEYDYKQATWGIYNVPQSAYDEIFELEKECCQNSDLTLTITEQDAVRFQELYGISSEKILNISAGYDIGSANFVLPSRRKITETKKVHVLYISSSAQVAVDAANQIVATALDFPDVMFIIAGSVGTKIATDNLPDNVKILGLVSDAKKAELLEACDFALNPIVGGSGLNIKMLEYFAYGIPVICTEFGARGIAVEDGVNCLITEIESLGDSITRFLSLSAGERDAIAQNAYSLYINNYTWRNCAMKAVSYTERELRIPLRDNVAKPEELELIKYPDKESYIPKGMVYIYGAGEWGTSCLSFLSNLGVTPVSFFDRDKTKWGKQIKGTVIRPPDLTFDTDSDYIVIFALEDFVDAIKFMVAKGLNLENVVIAFNGTELFRLYDGEGAFPYYMDINKIKGEVGA